MADDYPWFEQTGGELRDDEFPDEDPGHDDFPETLPCPACGAEVYEDAVQCPVCGEYITHSTSVWAGRPVWWILLGLIGLIAAVAALAGLMPH